VTDLTSRAFKESISSIDSLIPEGPDITERPKLFAGVITLKRLADLRAEEEKRSGDLPGFLAYAPLWEEITAAESPGAALTAAFSRLEEAHPGEERWLDGLVFSPERDDRWKEIVTRLADLPFGDADIDDPDALAEIARRPYRNLLSKTGHIETSRSLACLLAELLAPESGMRVYDPFFDGGPVLVEAAGYARAHGGDVTLYTQMPTDYARLATALTLLLHNCPEAHIATGDIISKPGFVEGRRVARFDRVVGVVPAGRNWGRDAVWPDPYLRFIYGASPSISGEAAYLSHAIASLADGGRLVAVVPAGLLSRTMKREKAVREAIIREDLIEAVIAIPDRLVLDTGMTLAVLVICPQKTGERQEQTVFIDASALYQAGRGQNFLRAEDRNAVLDAYASFKTVEGFSAVASGEEIAAKDFTLDVSQYVLPLRHQPETVDLDAAVAELKEIRKKKADALDRFLESVAHLDQEPGQ